MNYKSLCPFSRISMALLMLSARPAVAGPQPAPTSSPAPRPSPNPSPTPRFIGWQVYEENDSLVVGDERYTQGLKFTINANPERLPRWVRRMPERLSGLLWSDDEESYEPGFSITFGQSIYTPRIITSTIVDANDRAFSGFLYLGGQLQFTGKGETSRHIIEANVGAFGRESLARSAQGGLHVLKTARIPKGWDQTNPLHGVGVNLYYRQEERDGRIDEKYAFRWDVTTGQVAELGNMRTSYGWHGALRVGYRLSGFPASTIAAGLTKAGTKRPAFEGGGIFGLEARTVLYTTLVQPTANSVDFSASPFVLDTRAGAYVRIGSFRLTAQKVWRSPEFTIGGKSGRNQDFVSIAGSYEPYLGDDALSAKEHGIEIELGMGANVSGPRLQPEKPPGIAGHFALRKGLWKGFNLGFELGGIGVASDVARPAPDTYADLFLRQTAVTVGWKPRGQRGRLAFRAGSSFLKQTVTIQTIAHPVINGQREEDSEPHPNLTTGRGGWLAGVQYFIPVERHVAVGVDVGYQSLSIKETIPGLVTPRFVKAVFAVQIRP